MASGGGAAAIPTPTVASQPSMGTIGGTNTQAQLDARKAWIDGLGQGSAGYASAMRDYQYDLGVFNEKNAPKPSTPATADATATDTATTAAPATPATTAAPYAGPKGVSDDPWFQAQEKTRTYGKTIADMMAASSTTGAKGASLGGGTTKLG